MSKINFTSTAFNVAYTKSQLDKLENKIFDVLEEVETIRGPMGLDGKDGVDGNRGPQGARGHSGKDGVDGKDGIDGATGPSGKDGLDGDTGPIGLRGDDGVDGNNGLDGVNGRDGKDGVDGVDGRDGVSGNHGVDGLHGVDGKDGIDGQTGKDGKDGLDGKDGVDGKDGIDGLDGKTGEKGEKGDKGVDAPDYEPKFEQLLEDFNKRVAENQTIANKNVAGQIKRIEKSLSTLGGGGSYKILDNADVDKTRLSSVVGDSILVFDPVKKKFVVQPFLTILDRLKADLEVQYDKLVDEDAVNSYTYVGEAVPGTDKSASIWRIKRIYELSDGDLEILWANGTASLDKTWTDRASYIYDAD